MLVSPGGARAWSRPASGRESASRTSQVAIRLSRRTVDTRSPAQERAKLRGTGTTTEPAQLLLEELYAGSWESRSTRVGEAALELPAPVGMPAHPLSRC